MGEQEEYDPKGKGLRDLSYHVFLKGVQTGAVIGTVLVGASAVRAAVSAKRAAPTLQQAVRTLAVSQGWAVLAAGLMQVGLIYGKGVDESGLEDRAYRIHYNESQNRTDRFAGAGYAVGALIGGATGGLRQYPILGYGGLGCTAGIVAHLASSSQPVEEKVPSINDSQ